MTSRRTTSRRRAAVLLAAAVIAPTLVAAPAAAGDPAPALTKERLYELAAHRSYGTPVRLDVPGDPMPSELTDSGIVVGTTRIDGAEVPFRWHDGRTELLPPQDADWLSVGDVNERGQVIVVHRFWGGRSRVVLWQPDGSVEPLGDVDQWESVNGINDDGVVVGVHYDPARPDPFLATWQDGVVTELPAPGGRRATPGGAAINAAGDVAGTVEQPDGTPRGYVWRDGVATELPAPPGARVAVHRITDTGDVVGEVGGVVVLWEDGRRLRDVDPKDRFDLQFSDVNAHGVVVGTSGWGYLTVPVRSSARGVASVLPGLGQQEGLARAVHDLDVVVGSSGFTSPRPVMWVLTVPVPLGLRLDGGQATGGWAVDINRGGQVAGWLFTVRRGEVTYDVVLWDLVPGR